MKGALAAAALLLLAPAWAAAQEPSPDPSPPPLAAAPTARERTEWVVDGVLSPQGLAIGVVSASWQTLIDVPDEWGTSWTGFGRRYGEREADVALSRTIEAGLGALWGEDPRYRRSTAHGVWPRVGWALKTVVVAPRRDGHLAPAWGRYAGDVFNNVIENAWLPPSATTPGVTALRSMNGVLGRVAGNLWREFWPDVWDLIRRRGAATGAASPPPGGR